MVRWTALALEKAGCRSREAFQRKQGIVCSNDWDPATCRALIQQLTGYRYHRLRSGESLYQVAQLHGTSVRAILTSNPYLEGGPLPAGAILQVPLEGPVVSWDLPLSSWLQELYLEGLQARCPHLEAWPLTQTDGGRNVWALRLGRGKRKVLLTAAHHGNEWITGLLLWRLLEDYCSGIGEDGSLFGFSCRELLQRTSLYMVPMADPDGVDLAVGAVEPDSVLYRQAEEMASRYPEIPFPEGWKANLQGVDLNLNYPARWELARSSKAKMLGPRDYPGEAPLDQPETRALALLTRRLRPDAVAAWHTQGGEIYGAHPDGRYPDRSLADLLAKASGYVLTQPPAGSENAGYRDWVLQSFDIPAFTIEAGRGENPLPLSDLRQLYEENLPIFALLLAG